MLLKRWGGGFTEKESQGEKNKIRGVCVEGGGGPLDKCISIKD